MARSVFGLLSPAHSRRALMLWNHLFEHLGQDACFDVYPIRPCDCPACTEKQCLVLRLSEMYLLGRRGYIIDPLVQTNALALMDALDESAVKAGRVDTVLNTDGVFTGFALEQPHKDPVTLQSERYTVWFGAALPQTGIDFLNRELRMQKS